MHTKQTIYLSTFYYFDFTFVFSGKQNRCDVLNVTDCCYFHRKRKVPCLGSWRNQFPCVGG